LYVFALHETMEEVATIDDPPQSDEQYDAGPPPVQYRLKTLLALTAVMSLTFATMGRLSVVWAVALAWFLLLFAAHVAASAVQTRATEHTSSRLRRQAIGAPAAPPLDMRTACAPTTRLGSQTRLGLGMAMIVGVGAMIGCGVGTSLIFFHNRGELGPPAFLLAAISSTGIGAFLSFLAGTCAKATSKAFREATTSADPRR
jgi:hypothetical protein